MKLVLVLTLFSFIVLAKKQSNSFIISFEDMKTTVIPQAEKGEFVGIIFKNETFEKIVGELRNESKVLKYMSLKAGHSESIQVLHKDYKKLFFVPVSPPSRKLPLKVGSTAYEIP